MLPILTCWYLEMLKFVLPPTPTLKFALLATRNPNASQWNIGCVVSPKQIFFPWPCRFRVVYPVFLSLGTQCELCSQWNMGLRTLLLSVILETLLYKQVYISTLYVLYILIEKVGDISKSTSTRHVSKF